LAIQEGLTDLTDQLVGVFSGGFVKLGVGCHCFHNRGRCDAKGATGCAIRRAVSRYKCSKAERNAVPR
jgi:hypothetical protein